VITEANPAVAQLLANAGAAAASTLASSEALTAADPTRDTEVIAGNSHALLAQFTGARSGELLLIVGDEMVGALLASGLGEADLANAFAPTLSAIAATFGPVALGPVQPTDARVGIGRVLANPDGALVPLFGVSGVRAAIGVAITPVSAVKAEAAPTVTPAGGAFDERQAHRLDMLRGVEMEATAELGRARLTVNDLLALRTGAVIELDRGAGGPADLFVNGRLIARGEVVVVDENYGLRITQVVADTPGR
jgi:flagellar motor switch protein FliN